MLTEYDVDGQQNEVDIANICDEMQISWLAWEYKSFAGALVNGTWFVKIQHSHILTQIRR